VRVEGAACAGTIATYELELTPIVSARLALSHARGSNPSTGREFHQPRLARYLGTRLPYPELPSELPAYVSRAAAPALGVH